MKFLVLALCVCAASAASSGIYKPWQPIQRGSQAFAQAVVNSPQFVAKTFEPAVKTFDSVVIKPIVKTFAPVIKPFENVEIKPVVKTFEPVIKPFEAVPKAVYGTKDANAEILRSQSDVNAEGFNYIYETGNGIAAQSTGTLKKVGNENVLAVQGSYQYITPEGFPAVFTYIADENGYQVKSDLLPVGPAIPEDIRRSLEYIKANPSIESQKY